MIKQLNTPLLIVIVCLISACSGSTKTTCVGASNPINVSLNNNGDQAQFVTLFSHTDKDGFVKIGQFEFEAYETKDICMDKDDELKNGLFVFNGVNAYGLQLDDKKRVEINLTGNKYQIISPEQLRDLIKAM